MRWLPPATLLLLTTLVAGAAPPPDVVRFASYNVSFFRATQGGLLMELNTTPASVTGNPTNIHQIAEALQRIRPDVLLLNEFDYDAGASVNVFADKFLATPQKAGLVALEYPYRYSAPSNTGISSGFDFDNNGSVVTTPGTDTYGNDSFGFGIFPGQYAPAVFSRFPIETAGVRTMQLFKWKDMPDSKLLLASGSPPLTTYYTAAERDVLRLSSKTHLDVPVNLGNGIMAHLLASHPTPPTFDAAEDKNGKRNFDEIRMWADYIDPSRAGYLYDDNGASGGLPAGARFVIGGDQNADPNDGATLTGAARQLTTHPLVNATFIPSSARYGAGGAAYSPGGSQTGNSNHDTAAFSGGLRVDYVLPSKAGFTVFDGAVFWPGPSDPLRAVVSDRDPSDHHMVWVDLRPQISLTEAVIGFDAIWNGTALILTWQAADGYAYKVQHSATMATGTWIDTGVAVSITPGTGQASAPIAASPAGKMFYRLQVTFVP